jgi:hypothetical protein
MSKEPNSPKTKRKNSLWLIMILIHTALSVVVFVIFLFWLVKPEEKSFQWGENRISVQQIFWHFPFEIEINQISYSNSKMEIFDSQLQIKMNLKSIFEEKMALFSIKSKAMTVIIFEKQSSDIEEDDTDLKDLNFDMPNLPVGFEFEAEKIELVLLGIERFTFKEILLNGYNENLLIFRLGEAQVSDQFDSIQALIRLKWEKNRWLELDSWIQSHGDTLFVNVEAPIPHITRVNAKLSLSLEKLLSKLPEPLDVIQNYLNHSQLQGSASWDLLQDEIQFDGEILGQSEEIYPFSRHKFKVKFYGKPDKTSVLWQSIGEKGERLELTGIGNWKNSNWSAELKNSYMEVGDYKLPINGKIVKASIKKDSVFASVKSEAGSQIHGVLSLNDIQSVHLKAKINPLEPWAIIWTQGNLILDSSYIEASVTKNGMKGRLETSSPYAYAQRIDFIRIDFDLNTSRIIFPGSYFRNRDNIWNWNGEVWWGLKPGEEFFRFKVDKEDAKAEIWGNFDLLLKADVQQMPIEDIPLATDILQNSFLGYIDGFWYTDRGKNKKGTGFIDVHTWFKNKPLRINLGIYENADSLIIEDMEILIDSSFILSTLHFIESPDTFYLKTGHFFTRKIDLEKIMPLFVENFPVSGILYGDLRLEATVDQPIISGYLAVDTLKFGDSSLKDFSLNRTRLNASDHSITVEGRLNAGDQGQWDSEFEIAIDRVFDEDQSYRIGIVTDLEGIFWSDGVLFKDRGMIGDFYLRGPWFVPVEGVYASETDAFGSLRWQFSQGIMGLDASLKHFNSSLSLLGQYHIKNKFNGELTRNHFQLQGKVYGDSTTEANLGFMAELIPFKLNQLTLESDAFSLDLGNQQYVKVSQFYTELKTDSLNVRFPFKSNNVFYQAQFPDVGNIRTDISPVTGELSIPIESKATSTSLAELKAQGQIRKFIFSYNNYPEISIQGLASGLFTGINSLINRRNIRNIQTNSNKPRGKGILLDLQIRDSGQDSIWALTNLYSFPLTADIRVTGSSNSPVLTGDINSVDQGVLRVMGTPFQISQIGANWQGQPILNGSVDFRAQNEYPVCKLEKQSLDETCIVELNAQGTLGAIRILPSAQCASQTDIGPDQVLAAIFMGCLGDDQSADWAGIYNKLLYKSGTAFIQRGVNQFFRWMGSERDYIKNLEFFQREDDIESDSSSIFISTLVPGISSDNLLFNFGRVWNTGSELDFDDYIKMSISLNLFNPNNRSGWLNPYIRKSYPGVTSWSMEAGLLSKNYSKGGVELGLVENRVEMNLGVSFERPFWSFCLFNWGHCD